MQLYSGFQSLLIGGDKRKLIPSAGSCKSPELESIIINWHGALTEMVVLRQKNHQPVCQKLHGNVRGNFLMSELQYPLATRWFRPIGTLALSAGIWRRRSSLCPCCRYAGASPRPTSTVIEICFTPPPHQRRALVWPWDWQLPSVKQWRQWWRKWQEVLLCWGFDEGNLQSLGIDQEHSCCCMVLWSGLLLQKETHTEEYHKTNVFY